MITRFLFISIVCLCARYAAAQAVFEKLTQKAEIACSPVKDQYLSGTCWSFASVSLFESDLLKQGIANANISEMFIARYAYTQRISAYLQQKGSTYFTAGGQFHNVLWVMKHYGLMPESVYSGLPKGQTKHNHGELDTILKRYAEKLVRNKQTSASAADWQYINRCLDKYLGKVPASFIYKGKKYTPQTWMTDYLKISPDDYLEFTSYSHHEWYQKYILEDKYNWSSDAYMNVPFADLKNIIRNALTSQFTVVWCGQVMDTAFHFEEGYATLKDTTRNLDGFRQQAFMDKTTQLDHLMHVVGLYEDEKGITWYRLKNSWGSAANNNGGFLYMNEDYFYTRGVNFSVNKNAIPAAIRSKIK
jgi:bleomycin hydrolase